MERTQSSDSRWRQVIAVQSELEQSMVTLPELVDRDFKPRKVSARTVRFAQALAFDVGWSGISEARARRAARVH
ncbi:MAG TPA: hypothetical protein VKA36_08705 [Solirubrobacterales bacterium]|nr:hypothetical protein [Solirubrobacterales bacterium]